MAVELGPYFDRFIENISLGEPQVSRINSASKTIKEFLSRAYEISESRITIQGSYANGTAVEPVEGGEYDVDLICECVDDRSSANAALSQLTKVFEDDGRFRDRVRPKKPCVRLDYAEDEIGKFHVDVVPVRRTDSTSPPLEAPRRDEGWRGTAPAEYARWCLQQGPLYLRTVKAMKRWRDEHQAVRQAVKSIVLQVLIAECMPQAVDDAERLAQTFRALHSRLEGLTQPPEVRNPVLPQENLAERWTDQSFRNFVSEVAEAVDCANKATAATDVVEATDAWQELLGNDFPVTPPSQLGIRLSDYSHAQDPADMGWSQNHDSRYSVALAATVQRGKRGQNRRPYLHNGQLLFAGHKLRFKALITAPNHVDVWWQVANTGGHARERGQLRGQIFRAKTLNGSYSSDPSENWEHTAYTGSHLMRAMLVRSDTVVAATPWFQVNIYAKGKPFRL